MAGVQTPVNPMQPYLDTVCKEFGLTADDPSAQAMARRDMQHNEQIAQIRQAQQAQFQLPAAVQDVCSKDPRLMQVQHTVNNIIQAQITNGEVRPEMAFNPAYIRSVAAMQFFDAQQPAVGNSQPVPAYQPPAFNGMGGGQFQGFAPSQPQGQAAPVNPQADALAQQMAAYTRIPLK